MKKLRAITSALAISFGLAAMPLSAATSIVNVPVVNGAWTFVGVPGFQNYGASSGTTSLAWGDASLRIIDGSAGAYQLDGLEVPTWDGNYSDQVTTSASTLDDDTTPRAVYSGEGVGINIYATVGVMVLGQETSGVLSSDTDHEGAVIAAIEYTGRDKNTESPIRTMYIQSPNAVAPDIKVLYQADYEGEEFLIQYETGTATALTTTDNTTYRGTFNRAYTYENAGVMGTNFPVVTATTSGGLSGNSVYEILHTFDMNLANNELNDTIQPNTTSGGAFNGTTYASSLRDPLEGNITVLSWDGTTQQWRQFRATAAGAAPTLADANDFDYFEQGKGYWVKVDKADSLGAPTYDEPAGFVLGYDATADINHSTFINDGWNMLSFGDEYLSYSLTGAIIPTAGLEDLNITDTYGAVTLSFDGVDLHNSSMPCTHINAAIDRNSTIGYVDMNIKCVPTTAGVALLSTRRFTVQTMTGTTPTDLLGTNLTETNDGVSGLFFTTRYGAKGLIAEINQYFQNNTTVDANMSILFPASTSTTPTFVAVDDAGTTVTALNAATGMAAAAPSGASTLATAIDFDNDGTADAVMMASDYRFLIKDATLVRTFNYDDTIADSTRANSAYGNNYWVGYWHGTDDNDTSVNIVGTNAGVINVPIVDDNLTHTAKLIDNQAPNTEVNATKLEGDNDQNVTLMVYYTGLNAAATTTISKIDLQEQGADWDVLVESTCSTYVNSSGLLRKNNECNATTRGAIGRVWNISTLASTIKDANDTNGFDGNYSMTDFSAYAENLGNTAFYAENYPIDGPLYAIKSDYGKQAELIITGKTDATDSTTYGTFISWKQIDVSKDPTEWYDSDDQYELFWTEKEQGYWVYINGDASETISFVAQSNGTNFTLNGTPYAHFNNHFATAATTSALTRNHLDSFSLTITADGITTYGTATANNDAWEVYATINGYKTSLVRTGATNDFTVSLDSHETAGIGFDEGEFEIVVTIAEASGQVVSSTYLMDYQKPVITDVEQDASTLNLTVSGDLVEAQVYTGDINDSSYGSSSATNWGGVVTGTTSPLAVNLGSLGITFPSTFATGSYLDVTTYNTSATQLSTGLVTDLRMTVKDAQGLYSDQEKRGYIAFYAGTGILSHSTSDTGLYDGYPTVYTDTGEVNATYDGTVDDGVQMKSASSSRLTCAYSHNNTTLDTQTANVRDLVLDDGTLLGNMLYMDDYVGQPFICQTGSGALYAGAFLDDGELNTGSTAAQVDRIVVVQISGVTATVSK